MTTPITLEIENNFLEILKDKNISNLFNVFLKNYKENQLLENGIGK
ncbi:hypothetical protein FACS1894132_09400 [Clostridia bacterium]|nr:hypothetical protein FACS1894132_09400 [Clostridia bacterium]